MANFVTKKDGTRVPFDPEKIRSAVLAAATEAEMPEGQASTLADSILSLVSSAFEGREEVSSAEIKEKVLSELDTTAPSVSESWRKYEESKSE